MSFTPPRIGLLKQVIAWLRICPGLTASFICGFLWMLVSWQVGGPKINLGASGAVLVACSIVAELFHQRWEFHWIIRRARGATRHDLEKVQPIGFDTSRVDSKLKALAKHNEYDSQLGDWYVGTTVMRVDRYLAISIGVVAVVGSVVWGYA